MFPQLLTPEASTIFCTLCGETSEECSNSLESLILAQRSTRKVMNGLECNFKERSRVVQGKPDKIMVAVWVFLDEKMKENPH